jgi:O-acetylhomoserine/O-acetylserine sulfhydrylase-like pyridoxal-dependent enzyme
MPAPRPIRPPARANPIYQTTSFVFDDVDHGASPGDCGAQHGR